jgi:hypothetical protein
MQIAAMIEVRSPESSLVALDVAQLWFDFKYHFSIPLMRVSGFPIVFIRSVINNCA